MKKVLVLIVATFICSGLFAQGIEFEHGTFKEALAKAKKENKLIFMDCYTSWCGPCKYLSKTIFPQKEVGDYFNQHFVSFKIDMEKGEGIELCKKYMVKSFPTLLFLDYEGNEVHKMVGGKPAEELIAGAKCAIDPDLRIGTLKEKYKNGNREYDFLMTYLTALKRQYDRVNVAVVSNELIETYSLEKFLTRDLFYVVSGSMIKYGSKEYQYLLKNKESILAKVDEKEYKDVFKNAIRTHLSQYANICKSLSDLNKEVDLCERDNMYPQIEALRKDLSYSYYLAQGQFRKWFDSKLQEAEQDDENQKFFLLLRIGDEVVRNPKFKDSKESINRALKIGHDLAATDNGVIMGNFLLAKLYLKIENKEKALKHFKLFFDNNEKAGGNNTHPSVSTVKNAIDLL